MSYTELLETNFKWWCKDGSKYYEHPYLRSLSFYNRDEIIGDNSDLLIELNRYVITEDSQTGKGDDELTECHPDFLEYINKKEYAGFKVVEIQRMYIDFLADINIVNKLINIEDDNICYIFISLGDGKVIERGVNKDEIPLTVSYFPEIDKIVTSTNFNINIDCDNTRYILSTLGIDYNDLFTCIIYYKSWGDNDTKILPLNFNKSDKDSTYEYVINEIINLLK